MPATTTLPNPGAAHGAPVAGAMHTMVHAQLPCATHAAANRLRAQELAWEWVAAKWPRLLPLPRDRLQRHFERALQDQALRVTTSKDGSVWTLSVMHGEKRSQRLWNTRLRVADTGHADMLGVQTACSDAQQAPIVVAPPRVLGAWVEQLPLEDGGFHVLSVPRQLELPAQLDAFCAHVLSERRRLPIIALTRKAQSRHYGVDPGTLALAVRGVAHVACLSPELAAAVPAILGPGSSLVHGTARIFAPGFHQRGPADRHPLVRDTRPADAPASDDPGAFRRKLCRHVCAIGVREWAESRVLAH